VSGGGYHLDRRPKKAARAASDAAAGRVPERPAYVECGTCRTTVLASGGRYLDPTEEGGTTPHAHQPAGYHRPSPTADFSFQRFPVWHRDRFDANS
jgi:hypothetical protein